jgi:hypothetical protein
MPDAALLVSAICECIKAGRFELAQTLAKRLDDAEVDDERKPTNVIPFPSGKGGC